MWRRAAVRGSRRLPTGCRTRDAVAIQSFAAAPPGPPGSATAHGGAYRRTSASSAPDSTFRRRPSRTAYAWSTHQLSSALIGGPVADGFHDRADPARATPPLRHDGDRATMK